MQVRLIANASTADLRRQDVQVSDRLGPSDPLEHGRYGSPQTTSSGSTSRAAGERAFRPGDRAGRWELSPMSPLSP